MGRAALTRLAALVSGCGDTRVGDRTARPHLGSRAHIPPTCGRRGAGILSATAGGATAPRRLAQVDALDAGSKGSARAPAVPPGVCAAACPARPPAADRLARPISLREIARRRRWTHRRPRRRFAAANLEAACVRVRSQHVALCARCDQLHATCRARRCECRISKRGRAHCRAPARSRVDSHRAHVVKEESGSAPAARPAANR